MVAKKGFLLLELIGALFLLALCIPLCMINAAHIQKLAHNSLQTYKRVTLIQNALEKARLSLHERLDTQIVESYTIETRITRDADIKNFLHIEVTLYDKDEKAGTWFSGVAVPYEA